MKTIITYYIVTIKNYLFTITLLLFCHNLNAQWVQTNGPNAAWIKDIKVASNGNLFASVNGDVGWHHSGGVYTSTNNGIEWTQVSNGLTGFLFNDLAFVEDGMSNSYLFVGGQSSGAGISRSTDHGANWVTMTNGLTSGSVYAIVLDTTVANDTRILLGSLEGVFISTNFGESWSAMNNGITYLPTADIVVASNGDYYAGSFQHGVFRSTNRGQSWFGVNTGLGVSDKSIRKLTIAPNGYLYASTLQTGIFRSTNSGEFWTPVSSGLIDLGISALRASPGGDIFAATFTSGIYRSTNDGTTWQTLNTGFLNPRVFSFLFKQNSSGGTEIFAANFWKGILYSNDNGESWELRNSGFRASIVNALFKDQQGNLFAGTDRAGVFMSSNGGSNWVNRINDFPPYCDIRHFTKKEISPGIFYLFAASDVGIFRTTDNGATFHPSNNGLPASKNIYAVAVSPSGRIFASMNTNGVYVSDNNGDNWIPANTGMTYKNGRVLFISPNGDVFAGMNGGGMYRSTDNGISWTFLNSGLTDTYMRSIVMDTLGILYAGTLYGGVHRSTDNGDTWETANSGLPSSSPIQDLATIGGYIFAATTVFSGNVGHGVYFSTNGGSTWEIFGTGLINTQVRSLGIDSSDPENLFLYAGTMGGGVWRLPIYDIITPVNNDPIASLPSEYFLRQNYPNPFNPSTIISYSLPVNSDVTLRVFDILGKEVAVLFNGNQNAGKYSMEFNAEGLTSGVYFYEIKTADFVDVKRMLLIK
jgi:ligand-binding sensor domain-containing protein